MTDEFFDSMSDVYERLERTRRFVEVSPHLLEIKTPEHLEEARQFVNSIIEQGVISANQLAKRTGMKPSAISAFRGCHEGKWRGARGTLFTTASKLCVGVDLFLRQRSAEEAAPQGCVKIRFVEAVLDLVNYASKTQTMVAFVAPAGAGKSTTLVMLRDEYPGACLVVTGKCRSGVKGFLQIFARSLGLDEHGLAADIQDRIVGCLVGSGRLVLVDECHKLQTPTLDVLREIWDATRVPMVLAGTPHFYTTLNYRRAGQLTAELMDQVYSRVAMYRDLTSMENPQTGGPDRMVSLDDIRKLFARGKIRLASDAADLLMLIANTPGSGCLRTCDHLVQAVQELYPDENLVTRSRLIQVLRLKRGHCEAEFVLKRAGVAVEDPPAQVATG